MDRCRKRFYEDYRHDFENDESFEIAYKKVKRIKDFYSHLKVYLVVNAIIIISNINKGFLETDLMKVDCQTGTRTPLLYFGESVY